MDSEKPYIKKAGLQDSEEEALTYMQEGIEDRGPAPTYEQKEAYVKNGYEMGGRTVVSRILS